MLRRSAVFKVSPCFVSRLAIVLTFDLLGYALVPPGARRHTAPLHDGPIRGRALSCSLTSLVVAAHYHISHRQHGGRDRPSCHATPPFQERVDVATLRLPPGVTACHRVRHSTRTAVPFPGCMSTPCIGFRRCHFARWSAPHRLRRAARTRCASNFLATVDPANSWFPQALSSRHLPTQHAPFGSEQ